MVASDALFRVEHIAVKADRIVFDIQVQQTAPVSTNAAIAHKALQVHPHLAQHTCVNSGGKTFGEVIESTPIIHLLEHMTIDILIQKARAAGRRSTVTATSEWTHTKTRQARIEFSYTNDLETLAAFNQAIDALTAIVQEA